MTRRSRYGYGDLPIRRLEHFPRQCGHTNLNLSDPTIAATLTLLIPIDGIASPDRTGRDSRFACGLRLGMTQKTFAETGPNFMVAAALLSPPLVSLSVLVLLPPRGSTTLLGPELRTRTQSAPKPIYAEQHPAKSEISQTYPQPRNPGHNVISRTVNAQWEDLH